MAIFAKLKEAAANCAVKEIIPLLSDKIVHLGLPSQITFHQLILFIFGQMQAKFIDLSRYKIYKWINKIHSFPFQPISLLLTPKPQIQRQLRGLLKFIFRTAIPAPLLHAESGRYPWWEILVKINLRTFLRQLLGRKLHLVSKWVCSRFFGYKNKSWR